MVRHLENYKLKTAPDAEMKRIMERALAHPEDAANLGTMGGVIPEAAYMNAINQTNQFSAEGEAMANRRRDGDKARGGEAAKEDLPRAGGEAAASRGPPLDWRPGQPIDVARMTREQWERLTDDELKAVHTDIFCRASRWQNTRKSFKDGVR
ncbi:MAG: hypothetical protein LBO05_05565 [Deltaproteobacteria bacterium]|nr:hypothetical protein [Deltaproteobacteria bacterium]